ncbi:hypothetical protein ACFQ1I_16335 [Kitasatospora arboriphila]
MPRRPAARRERQRHPRRDPAQQGLRLPPRPHRRPARPLRQPRGAYPQLTEAQLRSFFNDASFGVPADQVASTTRPRSDVAIVRDKATGVPHITGTTRYGTEFGAATPRPRTGSG